MFVRKNKQPKPLEGPRVPILGTPKPPPIPVKLLSRKEEVHDGPLPIQPSPDRSAQAHNEGENFHHPGVDFIPPAVMEDVVEDLWLDLEDKQRLRQVFKDNPELLQKFYNLHVLSSQKQEK